MRFVRAILTGGIVAVLAGCSVGPKYNKPTVTVTPAYKEPPPESYKESNGWKPGQPSDQMLRGKWWEIFGDPQLNALEDQLTLQNQDLKAADARFREARAMIKFNRAAEYPTISAAPGISTLRDSAHRPYFSSVTKATGDFLLPFEISYEIDFWGRIRKTVSQAKELAQASAADLETASLSLHAELAFDYFELRSADAQKRLLDDTVKAYTDNLHLAEIRYQGGVAPKRDVVQAQTQLDTTRVEDTEIGVQRAQFEHAVAVLIGKAPAEFSFSQQPLDLSPPKVPVGIPSQLLERRPDIAAAERRVAAANEQIGIARAAFFPRVVLSASAGLEGTSIVNWLSWPSRFWAAGPSMLQTLFDAGRRRASSEAALAEYDATVADYRQTALNAFQEVEDNLAALRVLEQESRQEEEAITSAKELLDISTNRYKGGLDNYLQVIIAQTALLSNQRNQVDILRRQMDASALLIKALGGGWNASDLPVFK